MGILEEKGYIDTRRILSGERILAQRKTAKTDVMASQWGINYTAMEPTEKGPY